MEPEMMSRSASSLASPLGADIMRAYDAHQAAEAESAAGWVPVCAHTPVMHDATYACLCMGHCGNMT